MKYIKRYNKFTLQTSCRICLTQSVTSKFALTAPLKGEQHPRPLVYEALELLTGDKLLLSPKYPDTVCGMCVELLKISYDLMSQYQTSKMKLKEQLGALGDDSTDVESDSEDPEVKAPVEILVGSKRFNIKDLLIVEEEDEDSTSYDGFLSNLGKTVSASFVKKGTEKLKLNAEDPYLVIEKVVQQEEGNTQVDISADSEDQFIDEPVITEVFKELPPLDNQEKDVLNSALNLKYKCPHCSKPMSSLTRAKIHSRTCDKNSSNVHCYVCGARFELRKHLLKHIKQVHLSEEVSAKLFEEGKSGKYKCRICGESFASSGSRCYHMSKHSGKKYKCDVCDKRFYTKTLAQSHLQTHSRGKTVVMCPICGKGFHYRSGLHYHMKMHTNERNIQCNYCPRRFYTRNSAKRHELTHTGARPYSCQYCEKKFRSLGEVKKHELLHTGERPYHCRYCDMGFTQTHNLKIHLMTHSGEFQCCYCFKGFADADILQFHLKHKHQVVATENATNSEENPSPELQLEENQAFYITEEYEYEEGSDGNDDNVIVKTYELRDEVLVETVESLT